MNARLLLAASSLLAVAACGSDFLPRSYLGDLRIIAVQAEPPEAGPGQTVTLRPSVFAPAGEKVVKRTWKFCPLTAGAQAGYACLSPKCEFPLQADGTGAATADPSALVVACALALKDESTGPAPSGAPAEFPESIETVFTFTAESSSGQVREAVVRVPLATRAAAAKPNTNPAIRRVWFDDQPATPGARVGRWVQAGASVKVRVAVDEGSLDDYVDASGAARTEDPVVSFFSSAGRFEGDRTSGVTGELTWTASELAPGTTEAVFYLVVRDLRGGQAVTGPFILEIDG